MKIEMCDDLWVKRENKNTIGTAIRVVGIEDNLDLLYVPRGEVVVGHRHLGDAISN